MEDNCELVAILSRAVNDPVLLDWWRQQIGTVGEGESEGLLHALGALAMTQAVIGGAGRLGKLPLSALQEFRSDSRLSRELSRVLAEMSGASSPAARLAVVANNGTTFDSIKAWMESIAGARPRSMGQ